MFSHKIHDNFCVTTQTGTIHARDVIKYLWVVIDFKLTWKTHIQFVLQKLCIAKGILNKIKCNVPQSVFRNEYFALAHACLYYALICTHKIQVQLIYIVKIITRSFFFKTRLYPYYIQLNLMKLKDIYELEVSKFVYKLIKNHLLRCFDNYFLPASKIYDCSTRFAFEYNWIAVMRCNKTLSQRLIN